MAPAAPASAIVPLPRPLRRRRRSGAQLTLVVCRIEASDESRLVSELEALLARTAAGPTRECVSLLLESARRTVV